MYQTYYNQSNTNIHKQFIKEPLFPNFPKAKRSIGEVLGLDLCGNELLFRNDDYLRPGLELEVKEAHDQVIIGNSCITGKCASQSNSILSSL
jgi:hypothetical protein